MKQIRKFVILSNPRTGSEYLVKLLNQHSKIHCLGEVFSTGPDGEAWNNLKSCENSSPFLYLDTEYNQTRKPIVGYKQIFYWLKNSSFENIEDFIKKSMQEGYSFILMTRNDTLRQYASFMIMMEQGLGHVTVEEDKIKSIHLEPAHTYMILRKWSYFERKCKEVLEKEQISYLHLIYEEDFDEFKLVKQKVFDFLSVVYEDIPDQLSRTNPFEIKNIITNYEEIITYLNEKRAR